MGGKGDSGPPPEITMPGSGTEGIMEFMGPFMAQMQQSMEQMAMIAAGAPAAPAMPEIFREPQIDWSEKQKELAAKMAGDFTVGKSKKKGREATIHTSPLLEEEDASTTGSILAGE